MTEQVLVLACTDPTCPAHGHVWTVELDVEGAPVDDAEATCPECYGAATPVQEVEA